ncbi:replication protein A 70 kDa DNA-binding subunit C [Trifolium repens]|nr:replication protein A 70 kDa DNA-binding subunit C [Trifolium repens]
MSGKFDFLADAVPGRISWRFKVRIARLWEVSAHLRPDVVNSLEMVLVDSKGFRIHATVRKQLVYLFQRKLEEGLVYALSFYFVNFLSFSRYHWFGYWVVF